MWAWAVDAAAAEFMEQRDHYKGVGLEGALAQAMGAGGKGWR